MPANKKPPIFMPQKYHEEFYDMLYNFALSLSSEQDEKKAIEILRNEWEIVKAARK